MSIAHTVKHLKNTNAYACTQGTHTHDQKSSQHWSEWSLKFWYWIQTTIFLCVISVEHNIAFLDIILTICAFFHGQPPCRQYTDVFRILRKYLLLLKNLAYQKKQNRPVIDIPVVKSVLITTHNLLFEVSKSNLRDFICLHFPVGRMTGFDFWYGRDFSLPHHLQTVLGIHPPTFLLNV
jgi:hypothetical protein